MKSLNDLNSVTEHETEMDMNEYQKLAHSTAIYPRVFTEHQVRDILTRAYLRNRAWTRDEVDEYVAYDLDSITTEFSRIVYPVLGLLGEAGEIANKLKKIARDQEGRMSPDQSLDYSKELGDTLWYQAEVASALGFDLAQIAAKNIDKLFSRKARGTLTGSGDER